MSTMTDKLAVEWRDTVNFVLGLWLLVSPWMLAYAAHETATANAVIVGAAVAVAAAAAIYAFQLWEEWANVALAAWLIVSPWVLKFEALQTATWNQVAVGIAVGALALWSANVEHGGRTASRK